MSVQLAQREIRGAQNVFDGVDGLFRTYLRGGYDPGALRDGLGSRFEMTGLSYKPYPCCRFNHTSIDAALAIARQPGFDAARIDRIAVGVNRQAYEAVCTPPEIRLHPQTVVQAQFSIPFSIAAALLDGQVSLRHFTDEGLRRTDILALAAKVDCAVDEAIERDWSRSISPAALLVQSGNVAFQQRIDIPRGHPDAPMTPDEADAKLRDCIGFGGLDWPRGTAERLRDLTARVEHLPAARDVAGVLLRAH
jgi:2-methylcitrate dehydratase PrpD